MLDGSTYVSIMFPRGNVQVFSIKSLLSHCRDYEDMDSIHILTKNGEFVKIREINEIPVKSLGWKDICYGQDRFFRVYRDSVMITENRGKVKASELKVSDLLYQYNQDSVMANDSIVVPYKLEAVSDIKDVPVADAVKEPAYAIVTESGDFLANDFLCYGGDYIGGERTTDTN